MNISKPKDLYFSIVSYRKMIKRIVVIYVILLMVIVYFYYGLTQVQVPTYYATSESGMLKKLDTYEQSQIRKFFAGR